MMTHQKMGAFKELISKETKMQKRWEKDRPASCPPRIAVAEAEGRKNHPGQTHAHVLFPQLLEQERAEQNARSQALTGMTYNKAQLSGMRGGAAAGQRRPKHRADPNVVHIFYDADKRPYFKVCAVS
jgi:hypothetical protein